ncbi:MAG: flagellar protein FlaR, partial [Fimbriimonadaceae bacterium]
TIIFVDHPIWVHFWWAAERQIAAAKGEQRLGGPEGCDLNSITKLMFETIWRVHEEIRPKLLELFEGNEYVVWIRSPEQLDEFMASLA